MCWKTLRTENRLLTVYKARPVGKLQTVPHHHLFHLAATGCDACCNPAVLNKCGIVFRFGHSLLKLSLERLDGMFAKQDPPAKLSEHFFDPDLLCQPGMLDEIIRGLTTVSMETLDRFVTDEVTGHLFEDKKKPFSGLDLASLNIQRGIDHCLQPYNEYRALCNPTRARTFDDLHREIARPVIERMK